MQSFILTFFKSDSNVNKAFKILLSPSGLLVLVFGHGFSGLFSFLSELSVAFSSWTSFDNSANFWKNAGWFWISEHKNSQMIVTICPSLFLLILLKRMEWIWLAYGPRREPNSSGVNCEIFLNSEKRRQSIVRFDLKIAILVNSWNQLVLFLSSNEHLSELE